MLAVAVPHYQSPRAQKHCWLSPTCCIPWALPVPSQGRTLVLWGGDRSRHASLCRTFKDGPGVCRLTEVSSCDPLLCDTASSGMQLLLPKNTSGTL